MKWLIFLIVADTLSLRIESRLVNNCTTELSIEPKEEEQVYSTASNFSLICLSRFQVKWSTPNKMVGKRLLVQDISQNGCFSQKLTIFNSSTDDVGYYNCRELTKTVILNEYRPDSKDVYIYVKDVKKLIANSLPNIVNPVENGKLTLDYKPSFPDVKVALFLNGNQVYPSDNYSQWKFNPRKGFTKYSMSLDDSGSLKLSARLMNHSVSQTVDLNVVPSPKPMITVLKAGDVPVNDPFQLNCSISLEARKAQNTTGQHYLRWIVPDENGLLRGRIKLENHQVPSRNGRFLTIYKNLIISKSLSSDGGNYTCATLEHNAAERASVSINIRDREMPQYSIPLVIGISIAVTIVVIGVTVVLTYVCVSKNHFKLTENYLLKQMLKRDSRYVNAHSNELMLLPSYDKKWEFPRNRLKLGRLLGSGAFGMVVEAQAYGRSHELSHTVAVKMTKSPMEMTELQSLICELKTMVHMGSHLNIVNLLGACTKNLCKGELLLIVDYCRFGNIRQFLLRNRRFIISHMIRENQASEVNNQLEENMLESDKEINTAMTFVTDQSSDGDYDQLDQSILESANNSTQSEERINDDSSLIPSSSCREGMDEESNYCTIEDLEPIQMITTRDLMIWVFQITRGMSYLESKQILHGDLAARNILLADNNIIKICDFGLSRSIYHYNNYQKKENGPLPIKWMALESILDGLFSTKSDVWSFGIVLWEIFSLAKIPYPGMEIEMLVKKLSMGYRLKKPKYANNFLYNIMKDCWKLDPDQRPSFSDIEKQFDRRMEDSVRHLYTQLDSQYVKSNTEPSGNCQLLRD